MGEISAASATIHPRLAISAIKLRKVIRAAQQIEHLLHHLCRAESSLVLGLCEQVVESRVLEEREVQPVRVLHQHELDAAGSQFLQRLLVDVAHRLEQRAYGQQHKLHDHQFNHVGGGIAPTRLLDCCYHAVNKQLAHPGDSCRYDTEQDREDSSRHSKSFVRLPDQAKSARDGCERGLRLLAPIVKSLAQRFDFFFFLAFLPAIVRQCAVGRWQRATPVSTPTPGRAPIHISHIAYPSLLYYLTLFYQLTIHFWRAGSHLPYGQSGLADW